MGDIHPHKIRYWLHSTEKVDDPESFSQKTNDICKAYHEAEEESQKGVHTISVDEMTGIQALERKFSDKPTMPGQVARTEFEYIRHGTISLIAFMDVSTGQICAPYLNKTRTEQDFAKAVNALISLASDDKYIFVSDGLNTHKSETLVRLINEKCKLDEQLGEKGKFGILRNIESRTKFLTDVTHDIRFLYTPKHCSWLNQIEIWFSVLVRRLLKRKSYCSTDELSSSILRFIEQYNLTAKAFKWTYAGVPLTA